MNFDNKLLLDVELSISIHVRHRTLHCLYYSVIIIILAHYMYVSWWIRAHIVRSEFNQVEWCFVAPNIANGLIPRPFSSPVNITCAIFFAEFHFEICILKLTVVAVAEVVMFLMCWTDPALLLGEDLEDKSLHNKRNDNFKNYECCNVETQKIDSRQPILLNLGCKSFLWNETVYV